MKLAIGYSGGFFHSVTIISRFQQIKLHLCVLNSNVYDH